MQDLILSLMPAELATLASESVFRSVLLRLNAALCAARHRGNTVVELGVPELLGDKDDLLLLALLQDWLPSGFLMLCVRDETGHVHTDLEKACGRGIVYCQLDLAALR